MPWSFPGSRPKAARNSWRSPAVRPASVDGKRPALPASFPAATRCACQVVQILVAEKSWVGGSGFQVTDEMKVTVAGQAAILVLGLEEPYYFDEVQSIILYPGPYSASGHVRQPR